MKIEIVRADPTGNTTILVLSPVEPRKRAETAARLMALDGGWAEQVGFVSRNGACGRLDMMGGEFCGNASMSLAAFLAAERGLSEAVIPLSVSGAPEPVRCSARKDGAEWVGRLAMPLPDSVRCETFEFRDRTLALWAVRFPGICHVIVPKDALSHAEAEEAVRKWASDAGFAALGVLLFSGETLEMEPLVYVRGTDSAVWEHGCASGTSAVGAYLAVSAGGGTRADIRQPGGVIGVEACAEDGRVVSLGISGRVRLLGRGYAEI
jgi:diaminopimelate epimerase